MQQSTVFKKNTKLNFQPAQYEKNKIDKDNYGKKTKKIIKKNHVGKHYSNLRKKIQS